MREYNLSKEERAEISTKMTELLELCQIHHLSNSLTKTEYENVTFGANANQVSLADDQIRHHILIAGSNFVAVPKRDSVEVDMSKFMSHKGEKNE